MIGAADLGSTRKEAGPVNLKAGLHQELVDGHMVVSAGGLLFTGSIAPHDPSSRRLIREPEELPECKAALTGELFIDGPAFVPTAQTWRLYETLKGILEASGSSLEHLVRQRIFVRESADIPAVERVMDCFLKERPATTIVVVGGKGVNPEVRVSMDAIALSHVGTAAGVQRVPDPSRAAGVRYPAAVRASGFVFTSSLRGLTGDGLPAERLTDLGSAAAHFADYPITRSRQEPVLAQTWFSLHHIGKALEAAGTDLSNLLRLNGWVTVDIRD